MVVVMVVMLGEFGRSPKIMQPGPGRDHWADAGFLHARSRAAEELQIRPSAMERLHQTGRVQVSRGFASGD